MSEKNLSPKIQLENFTKKLESPSITLLQTQKLFEEFYKLANDIFEKEKRDPTKEEEKVVKEFRRKHDKKYLSFVDKWEQGDFSPSEREIDSLQMTLANILMNKARLKKEQESENYQKNYQKNKEYTQQIDDFKEDNEIAFSYHDKFLFLISQHYKEQSSQNSSSSNQKKNPTVLPWTLAIIFGIMMVISFGVVGYLYYKQRKIKQFKV